MYLSIASVLLLLLLAWYYSIQVTAHQTARNQVASWLQSMGARADQVEFRMLRGALTIHHIKAKYQGGDLLIQQLFIKGNPASITSEHPALQQIIIKHLTYDASILSQSWEQRSISFPASLSRLFYHAKHIQLTQADFSHVFSMPELTIEQLNVSGSAQQREVVAQGFIGHARHAWQMNSTIPAQSQRQTGHITAQYHQIINRIDWSGSWFSQNMHINILQQQGKTSLQFNIQQKDKQWLTHFHANAWRIQQADMKASITGQGEIIRQNHAWVVNSPKLTFQDIKLPQLQSDIAQGVIQQLHLNTAKQLVHIEHILIQDATGTIDTYSMPKFNKAWHISLDQINFANLTPTVLVHHAPITLPTLHGYAKVVDNQLEFDVSGQSTNEQFIRIRSQDDNIHLIANAVPLRLLRNLLPQPLQEEALTLQGKTQLQLTIKPWQQWQTTGTVKVKDMQLASKNQSFKASVFDLHIQHANLQGVQQATATAEQWYLQLPLTPRQAWGTSSHLDDWLRIPWQLQSIQFTHGSIRIGSDQPWLSQASLDVSDWQTQHTTLHFQSEFGLSRLNTSMVLQADAQHIMQWQELQLAIQRANMFTLSPWLSLSGLPAILQGQVSLHMQAHKKPNLQGKADISFYHLQCASLNPDTDYLLQTLGQTGQSIIQRLSQNHRIAFHLQLEGSPEQDLGAVVGQSLLQAVFNKLEHAQPPKPYSEKRKVLGSIRIHQNNPLSHNERTRLRRMIKKAKKHGWHIELLPDLGTSELTPQLATQIYQTQSLIKQFMAQRGIKPQNIYLIAAQDKHHSTSSTASIHVHLVK